jgi:hypothetical protein
MKEKFKEKLKDFENKYYIKIRDIKDGVIFKIINEVDPLNQIINLTEKKINLNNMISLCEYSNEYSKDENYKERLQDVYLDNLYNEIDHVFWTGSSVISGLTYQFKTDNDIIKIKGEKVTVTNVQNIFIELIKLINFDTDYIFYVSKNILMTYLISINKLPVFLQNEMKFMGFNIIGIQNENDDEIIICKKDNLIFLNDYDNSEFTTEDKEDDEIETIILKLKLNLGFGYLKSDEIIYYSTENKKTITQYQRKQKLEKLNNLNDI